jgi:hypothetical protein
MNGLAVIVRTCMGNLLVITSYMVNDYLSNQTLMPGSQYVVKLHIRKKYQEAMLRNDRFRKSIYLIR